MSRDVPVVLPIRPRAGWAQAGRTKRTLALAALPLVAVDAWAITADDATLHLGALAATAVSFAAVARVLRPYPPGTRQIERTLRHLTSAVATTLGGSFFLILGLFAIGTLDDYSEGDSDGDAVFASFFLWEIAALLFVVTIVWGAIAVLIRFTDDERRDHGRHARPAGSDPSGGGLVGEDHLTGSAHAPGGYELVAFKQRT